MSESTVMNCVEKLESTLQSSVKCTEKINNDSVCLDSVSPELNLKEDKFVPVNGKLANGCEHTPILENGSGDSNESVASLNGCDDSISSHVSASASSTIQNGEETSKDIPLKSNDRDSLQCGQSDAPSSKINTLECISTSSDCGKGTSVNSENLPESDQSISKLQSEQAVPIKKAESQNDTVDAREEQENQESLKALNPSSTEPDKTAHSNPHSHEGRKDLFEDSDMQQNGIVNSEEDLSSLGQRNKMDVTTMEPLNSEKDKTERESELEMKEMPSTPKLDPKFDEPDDREVKVKQGESTPSPSPIDNNSTLSEADLLKTTISEICITDVKSHASHDDALMKIKAGNEEIEVECNVKHETASQIEIEVKDETVSKGESHTEMKVKDLPQDETAMESKSTDDVTSVEPLKTEGKNSCQDLPEQKSELIEKRDEEVGQEEMETNVNLDSDSKGAIAISTPDLNVEKDVKPMDVTEEQEKHGLDSLQISQVQSCSDLDNDLEIVVMDKGAKDLATNTEVKVADDELKGIGSKEVHEEHKSTDCKSFPLSKMSETDDANDSPSQSDENQMDLTSGVLPEGDSSAVKVPFKDILKQCPSQNIVKESTQDEKLCSDTEDAIVIDEIETVPESPSKTENKKEEPEGVPEPEKVLSKSASETNSILDENISLNSNDRQQIKKRPVTSLIDDSESESSSTKRQRLDSVVNKLGEHVGVKPSEATTVIMDSDDDNASSPHVSEKAVAVDQTEPESGEHTVKLSSQVLRNLIKASLRSFVKNQKLDKELQIIERMRKMENATELWRETAKHLEKSVNDLTSYTKELQKRKGQSSKLKLLSSRTVAVQVSLERTPNVQVSLERTPNQQNQSKTTNSQNYNRSTSLSLPPSVLRHPVATQPPLSSNRPMPQAQVNGNLRQHPASSPRQQFRAVGPRGNTSFPTVVQQSGQQQWRNSSLHQNSSLPQTALSTQHNQVMKTAGNSPVVHQSGRAGSRPANAPISQSHASHSLQGSASNMIDLTAEDDASKQAASPLTPSSRISRPSAPPSGVKGHVHGSLSGRGVIPDANSGISQSNQNLGSGGLGANDKHNLNSARRVSSTGAAQFIHVDQSSVNNVRNKNTVNSVSNTKSSSITVNSSTANGHITNRTTSVEPSSKVSLSGITGASSNSSRSLPPSVYVSQPSKHPAPLPVETFTKAISTTQIPPPKPSLKISRVAQGIVLSWNMPTLPSNVANIASYQLFAYQETNSTPSSSLWKKVGDVKALPLPMACTLVQFQEGNKYYFAVRAIDVFGRWGEYSDPSSIYLFPK